MPTSPPPPYLQKTARMRLIEQAHRGRDIRHILIDLYNRHGSQAAVAEALGLSQATIARWLARCGILTASWNEAYLAPARAALSTAAGIKKTPTEGGQLG